MGLVRLVMELGLEFYRLCRVLRGEGGGGWIHLLVGGLCFPRNRIRGCRWARRVGESLILLSLSLSLPLWIFLFARVQLSGLGAWWVVANNFLMEGNGRTVYCSFGVLY